MSSDLHDDIERAAARGGAELRARRAASALAAEAPRALALVWLLPLFGLLVALGALVLGVSPRLLSPALLLALIFVAPLADIALFALRAWLVRPARERALALVDEELELRGRLRSAAEFLELPAPGGFQLATLEDAAPAVRRAAEADLARPRRGWSPGEESAPHFVAALLLFALYTWLAAQLGGTRPELPSRTEAPVVAALDPGQASTESGSGALDEKPSLEAEAPKLAIAAPKTEAKRGEKADKLPDEMKTSAGKTGQGKSSEAQSQSSASESRGAPSGQSPSPPKEGAKPNLETKKPKKKAPAKETPRDPKEEGDPGGSTAGRGSAKGSNRNTTTSKWSSKDQVTTPDDQEIEDDEDTEDEDEEQKSRGGMQPNLRDRRPPVSRDLRIGFGNRPSPDANGRGGPSEGKKSRGTASLVLGVPIPDRIKGQPNAGPTRITQERIEPSAEDQTPAEAQARAAREAAIGALERPAPTRHPRLFAPWQAQLVRAFVDAQRTTAPPAPIQP